jgi:phage-related baseplate assembly protein
MTSYYAPTAIDLRGIAVPKVLQDVDYEALREQFIARFLERWDQRKALYPDLPDYDMDGLETDPIVIAGEAWAAVRMLDRTRMNELIKSLLVTSAEGTDLENIVARTGVTRAVVKPADGDTPAVMETDDQLKRRYLQSVDKGSAGSRDRFLYEAFNAWPGMLDARVNGHAVHGRRGDVDVVIIGPDGEPATDAQFNTVRSALLSSHVQPEAVDVSILRANRALHTPNLTIEVAPGPDPALVQREALARVLAAGKSRILIGGEIPPGFYQGAAYGLNVLRVTDNAPIAIAPDPYTAPVIDGAVVTVVVRP